MSAARTLLAASPRFAHVLTPLERFCNLVLQSPLRLPFEAARDQVPQQPDAERGAEIIAWIRSRGRRP